MANKKAKQNPTKVLVWKKQRGHEVYVLQVPSGIGQDINTYSWKRTSLIYGRAAVYEKEFESEDAFISWAEAQKTAIDWLDEKDKVKFSFKPSFENNNKAKKPVLSKRDILDNLDV